MANAKSSIILNEGLNSVHTGAVGSYFALKYWLPMYDPRIDNEIHSSTQALTSGNDVDVYPLSGTLSATHEYADLEGEKIFNADSSELQSHVGVSDSTDVYTLSTSLNYVVCASPNIESVANGYTGVISYTSAAVTNTSQRNGVKTNLIGDGLYSISDVLSATTLSANSTGDFTGTEIGLIPKISEIDYSLAGGSNVSAAGLLYPVNSFSSMVVSGDNVDAGRYNVRLETHGDFRFNKFILFVAKMNADGTEDTTYLPVPFSVSVFEGTTEKVRTTNDGTGLQWEGIIQLAFQRDPTQNNLTNLIIDTWTDLDTSAFTIATNKKVHIFDSDSNVSPVYAKLTVTDDTINQLALSYDTNVISYLTTSSDGKLIVSADDSLYVPTSATFTGRFVIDSPVPTNGNPSVVLNRTALSGADNWDVSLLINNGIQNPGGIGIFSNDNAGGAISFASQDGGLAWMKYNHLSDQFEFKVDDVTGFTITSADSTFDVSLIVDNTTLNVNEPFQILNTPVAESTPLQIDLAINNGADSSVGLSILGTNTSWGTINFGRENDALAAWLSFYHVDGEFAFNIGTVDRFTLTSAVATFEVPVAISTISTPLSAEDVYVKQGTGSTVTTKPFGLMVDSSTNAHMTLIANTGFTSNLYFADPASLTIGEIRYDHSTDTLSCLIAGSTKLSMTSTLMTIPISATFVSETIFSDYVRFDDSIYWGDVNSIGGFRCTHTPGTSSLDLQGNRDTTYYDMITLTTTENRQVDILNNQFVFSQSGELDMLNITSLPAAVSNKARLFTSADPGDTSKVRLYLVKSDGTSWKVTLEAPT